MKESQKKYRLTNGHSEALIIDALIPGETSQKNVPLSSTGIQENHIFLSRQAMTDFRTYR